MASSGVNSSEMVIILYGYVESWETSIGLYLLFTRWESCVGVYVTGMYVPVRNDFQLTADVQIVYSFK